MDNSSYQLARALASRAWARSRQAVRRPTAAQLPATAHFRAERCGSQAILSRACWGLFVVGLVVGCGGPTRPPVEQAEYLFAHGEFAAAIKLADETLPATVDNVDRSRLLITKGRSYWEQTASIKDAAEAKPLLDQALTALSDAIQENDSAEGRHFRSMVYEELGQADLAAADQVAWRSLDPSYRSAYLNERVEEVLLDSSLDEDESEVAAAEAESETATAEWRPPHESPTDRQLEEDDRAATEGSVTSRSAAARSGSEDNGEAANQTAGSRHERSEANEGESSRTATARRRGERPRTQEFEDFSGRGSANQDANDLAADDRPAESDDQRTGEEEPDPPAESGPARPRIPGSTWQPWLAGDEPNETAPHGALPPLTAAPSTGLVGPSVGGEQPLTGPGGAGVGGNTAGGWSGGVPTTGLTGPTYPSGPADMTSPAGPTTGIVAPPPSGSLPSGLPTVVGSGRPRTGGPALPFTGALPQTQQPRTYGSPLANLATNGPNYSPLRPSPLTDPRHPLNRGPLLQRPLVGNSGALPTTAAGAPPRPPLSGVPVAPVAPIVPGAGSSVGVTPR